MTVTSLSFKQNLWIVFLTGVLFSMSGCASALLTPIYLIKGTDVPAEFKKEVKEIPKESKIVVICRSSLNLYGNENPNSDLSNGVTLLMKKKLEKKKLEWLPFEEVESVFDESSFEFETFEKMGAKLNVDYVLGVDIDSFDIYLSPDLYQGKAKVHVTLVEVATGDVIAQKSLPQYVFPPNPVPVSGRHPSDFQRLFIAKLSNEIGNLFYPHDPHDKYAQDNDIPDR